MTYTKTRANANMPNNFVSVLDYGADPTGSTDSTSAFQAAIDASSSVLVPSGTYLIEGMIDIQYSDHIFGNFEFIGEAETYINTRRADGYVIRVDYNVKNGGGLVDGTPRFENLIFVNALDLNSEFNNSFCIYLRRTSRAQFVNCKFYYYQVSVDLHISDSSDGSNYTNFQSCSFGGTVAQQVQYGIRYSLPPVSGSSTCGYINNCIFQNTSLYLKGCQRVKITNSDITAARSTVYLGKANVIENCYIERFNVNASLPEFTWFDVEDDCIIKSCTITCNETEAAIQQTQPVFKFIGKNAVISSLPTRCRLLYDDRDSTGANRIIQTKAVPSFTVTTGSLTGYHSITRGSTIIEVEDQDYLRKCLYMGSSSSMVGLYDDNAAGLMTNVPGLVTDLLANFGPGTGTVAALNPASLPSGRDDAAAFVTFTPQTGSGGFLVSGDSYITTPNAPYSVHFMIYVPTSSVQDTDEGIILIQKIGTDSSYSVRHQITRTNAWHCLSYNYRSPASVRSTPEWTIGGAQGPIFLGEFNISLGLTSSGHTVKPFNS